MCSGHFVQIWLILSSTWWVIVVIVLKASIDILWCYMMSHSVVDDCQFLLHQSFAQFTEFVLLAILKTLFSCFIHFFPLENVFSHKPCVAFPQGKTKTFALSCIVAHLRSWSLNVSLSKYLFTSLYNPQLLFFLKEKHQTGLPTHPHVLRQRFNFLWQHQNARTQTHPLLPFLVEEDRK